MIASAKFALTAAVLSATLLPAADTGMLSLVMPDAQVVSGISVDQSKASPFGQYVLTQMQADDANFQKFIAVTGFDPRRDLREVIFASNADPKSKTGIVMARGTFDAAKITAFVQMDGHTVTAFQGVNLITDNSSKNNAIAFVDNSLALAGDIASVKAAIQRRQGSSSAPATLIAKVQEVSSKNDVWFVSLVPMSQFNLGNAGGITVNGQASPNMLQSIQAANGGVRFGSNILVSAEATTRSPQDATALADVVRFMATMAQMQAKDNAADVATILNSLNLQTTASTLSMTVTVPESQLEQILINKHSAAGVASSSYRIRAGRK